MYTISSFYCTNTYFSLQYLKKNQKNTIHRGEVLQKVAAASELTVDVLVTRMKYKSRNTFYSHVKKADLSLIILSRYGRVLRYDFAADIEEMNQFKLQEEEPGYLKGPSSLEQAVSQRDYYHKLYMDLLEKVRSLEEENEILKQQFTGKKK